MLSGTNIRTSPSLCRQDSEIAMPTRIAKALAGTITDEDR